MRILVPIVCLCIALFACRSTPKQDVSEEIATLEAKLANTPDQETLKDLLALYQRAGDRAKEQETKLDYLWKTGETARALREFDIAESAFVEIYNQHPETEQASKALFLHAFMCDEDLNQIDRARQLYEDFIAKYPESDFNDDAQFLLEHLGKSDEEMLEFLNQQNN